MNRANEPPGALPPDPQRGRLNLLDPRVKIARDDRPYISRARPPTMPSYRQKWLHHFPGCIRQVRVIGSIQHQVLQRGTLNALSRAKDTQLFKL
jgi:hypothetical protein